MKYTILYLIFINPVSANMLLDITKSSWTIDSLKNKIYQNQWTLNKTITHLPKRWNRRHIGSKNTLIIDTGMYKTSLTAFKDRVLQHYRISDGEISKMTPSIEIRQWEQDYYHIKRAPHLSGLSIDQWKRLKSALHNNRDIIHTKDQGHGDAIFNVLAERTSNTNFVIIHQDKHEEYLSILKRQSCSVSSSRIMSRLRSSFQKLQADILRIIREYNISYANFSWGLDPKSITKLTDSNCSKRKRLMVFREAHKLLFSLYKSIVDGGVIIVQAGPYDLSDEDLITQFNDFGLSKRDIFESDCKKLSGRYVVSRKISDDLSTYGWWPQGTEVSKKQLGESIEYECSQIVFPIPETSDGKIDQRKLITNDLLRYIPMPSSTSHSAPYILSQMIKADSEQDLYTMNKLITNFRMRSSTPTLLDPIFLDYLDKGFSDYDTFENFLSVYAY